MATSCYRPSMTSLSSSSKTSLSNIRARVHLLHNPRRLKCGNLMISNSNYNAALPKSSSSSAPGALFLATRPRRPSSSPSLSFLPPHSSGSTSGGEVEEKEEEEEERSSSEVEEEGSSSERGESGGDNVGITVLQYLMVSMMLPLLLNVNWWVRIGLSTILIRLATLPVLINQKKLDPEMAPMVGVLRQIIKKKRNKDDYRDFDKLKNEQFTILFNKYGWFALLNYEGSFMETFISVAFCVGLAIMVTMVPSFKQGGAYWFADLTTQDYLNILPDLASFFYCIKNDCRKEETASLICLIKKKFRNEEAGDNVIGLLFCFCIERLISTWIMESFPNALFCFFIPSDIFSILYELVVKIPRVKELLRLP